MPVFRTALQFHARILALPLFLVTFMMIFSRGKKTNGISYLQRKIERAVMEN